MNFKKFISGVSALAIAASAFAGLAVTASASASSYMEGGNTYAKYVWDFSKVYNSDETTFTMPTNLEVNSVYSIDPATSVITKNNELADPAEGATYLKLSTGNSTSTDNSDKYKIHSDQEADKIMFYAPGQGTLTLTGEYVQRAVINDNNGSVSHTDSGGSTSNHTTATASITGAGLVTISKSSGGYDVNSVSFTSTGYFPPVAYGDYATATDYSSLFASDTTGTAVTGSLLYGNVHITSNAYMKLDTTKDYEISFKFKNNGGNANDRSTVKLIGTDGTTVIATGTPVSYSNADGTTVKITVNNTSATPSNITQTVFNTCNNNGTDTTAGQVKYVLVERTATTGNSVSVDAYTRIYGDVGIKVSAISDKATVTFTNAFGAAFTSVTVNGEDASNGIELAAGEYTVAAKAAGYEDASYNFTVTAADVTNGSKSVEIPLTAKVAAGDITVNYVDGEGASLGSFGVVSGAGKYAGDTTNVYIPAFFVNNGTLYQLSNYSFDTTGNLPNAYKSVTFTGTERTVDVEYTAIETDSSRYSLVDYDDYSNNNHREKQSNGLASAKLDKGSTTVLTTVPSTGTYTIYLVTTGGSYANDSKLLAGDTALKSDVVVYTTPNLAVLTGVELTKGTDIKFVAGTSESNNVYYQVDYIVLVRTDVPAAGPVLGATATAKFAKEYNEPGSDAASVWAFTVTKTGDITITKIGLKLGDVESAKTANVNITSGSVIFPLVINKSKSEVKDDGLTAIFNDTENVSVTIE